MIHRIFQLGMRSNLNWMVRLTTAAIMTLNTPVPWWMLAIACFVLGSIAGGPIATAAGILAWFVMRLAFFYNRITVEVLKDHDLH